MSQNQKNSDTEYSILVSQTSNSLFDGSNQWDFNFVPLLKPKSSDISLSPINLSSFNNKKSSEYNPCKNNKTITNLVQISENISESNIKIITFVKIFYNKIHFIYISAINFNIVNNGNEDKHKSSINEVDEYFNPREELTKLVSSKSNSFSEESPELYYIEIEQRISFFSDRIKEINLTSRKGKKILYNNIQHQKIYFDPFSINLAYNMSSKYEDDHFINKEFPFNDITLTNDNNKYVYLNKSQDYQLNHLVQNKFLKGEKTLDFPNPKDSLNSKRSSSHQKTAFDVNMFKSKYKQRNFNVDLNNFKLTRIDTTNNKANDAHCQYNNHNNYSNSVSKDNRKGNKISIFEFIQTRKM